MKDFISEIIGRVKAEQKSIAETVTAGFNVNSFEDYQRLVGRHEGLMLTLEIINQLLTEDEEDES
jgi:hypothetical protein